ncbi:coiled-coil protein [Legionella busanensis]|uniref:Coiled-coil protein n=1 Tax=Legionella busanensis TaxID=190655 RepID=A0A378JL03_9GAMM|nr:hypothetical protein [Legionella busanensis]STX52016.1 coiled-coil protein [Legionella busanensis]
MPLKNIREEFSYVNRPTSIIILGVPLQDYINKARINLERLLKESLPKEEQQDIEEQLAKINSLKEVTIPIKGSKSYYSMADKAGGVTEKTCLVDEDTLKKNLLGLASAETYAEVKTNKIRMNAIIKHPKSGKNTEVQREAIGLEIARILGFKVTDSTLILHLTGNEWRPCLFIPFGNMELLTEFIDDAESMHGRLKQTYFESVEDFGKYSAFFRLLCDPDFMGKEGQNKGLTKEDHPKILYIFDQVFMTTNNFRFDKAFNLIPDNSLSKLPKFSRHFMGRNKSVINDSSFEEKIQGAINILRKKGEIRTMLAEVSKANNTRYNDSSSVRELQNDAVECFKIFNERICSIEELFPLIKIKGCPKQVSDLIKDNDEDNLVLLKKAMLVTQLINKPKLYDTSGKPYRAPFFSNPSTYVEKVYILNNQVTISFARGIGPALSRIKKSLLEAQGFTIAANEETASISKDTLLKLTEQSYYKEQEDNIDETYNYLDLERIEMLANTYNENSNIILRNLIDQVKKCGMNPGLLDEVLDNLDKIPFKNKGFVEHIKQCCLYEVMKLMIKREPRIKQELEEGMTKAKQDGTLKVHILGVLAKERKSLNSHRSSFLKSVTLNSDQHLPEEKASKQELSDLEGNFNNLKSY